MADRFRAPESIGSVSTVNGACAVHSTIDRFSTPWVLGSYQASVDDHGSVIVQLQASNKTDDHCLLTVTGTTTI